MKQHTYIGTMNIVECCRCHMDFGMTPELNDQLRKTHEAFYCPAGHRQFYNAESNEEKLQRENNRLKQNTAYLEDRIENEKNQRQHAERSASAYKGKVTKIKNRIGGGVCPCCNRTFENLARHMEGQHPDFKNHEKETA